MSTEKSLAEKEDDHGILNSSRYGQISSEYSREDNDPFFGLFHNADTPNIAIFRFVKSDICRRPFSMELFNFLTLDEK